MMTGRDVGGDVPSEMTAICAFETFERRLLSTLKETLPTAAMDAHLADFGTSSRLQA
jgi:hypothetical protein